jgi:hypothetical protein
MTKASSRAGAQRGRTRGQLAVVLAALLSVVGLGSFAYATLVADEPAAPERAGTDARAEALALDLAEQWGIEITSIRLTAHNHMIDYRYRVLDADKATDLFKRQIKPHLIHQKTGKVLAVPETAKLGPLRNSNIPKDGKIYWMFFGNAGGLVQSGDQVTVVIGEFRVEDLVVE